MLTTTRMHCQIKLIQPSHDFCLKTFLAKNALSSDENESEEAAYTPELMINHILLGNIRWLFKINEAFHTQYFNFITLITN